MVDSTVGGLMDPTTEDIDYDAVIDGSAYYAEHVPVQDYVLRIGDLDIPVDLTKRIDPKDPYCQGEFIHNVTVDEMRRAFGSSFVTE